MRVLGGVISTKRSWQCCLLNVLNINKVHRGFRALHHKSGYVADESVMTLPQSGRLDGSEQPQGLPDAHAQRL